MKIWRRGAWVNLYNLQKGFSDYEHIFQRLVRQCTNGKAIGTANGWQLAQSHWCTGYPSKAQPQRMPLKVGCAYEVRTVKPSFSRARQKPPAPVLTVIISGTLILLPNKNFSFLLMQYEGFVAFCWTEGQQRMLAWEGLWTLTMASSHQNWWQRFTWFEKEQSQGSRKVPWKSLHPSFSYLGIISRL